MQTVTSRNLTILVVRKNDDDTYTSELFCSVAGYHCSEVVRRHHANWPHHLVTMARHNGFDIYLHTR